MRKRYDVQAAKDSASSISMEGHASTPSITNKNNRKRDFLQITSKCGHSLSTYLGAGGLLFLLGLYGLVYVMDGILPTPLTLRDEVSKFCLPHKISIQMSAIKPLYCTH